MGARLTERIYDELLVAALSYRAIHKDSEPRLRISPFADREPSQHVAETRLACLYERQAVSVSIEPRVQFGNTANLVDPRRRVRRPILPAYRRADCSRPAAGLFADYPLAAIQDSGSKLSVSTN